MPIDNEHRHRYRIIDSHRDQKFVARFMKHQDTFAWTWKAQIDFADGHELEFASQRSFNTLAEAEDYLRRFVCARIDSHLNSA